MSANSGGVNGATKKKLSTNGGANDAIKKI